MKNKSLIILVLIITLILSVPLIAMQFSPDVNWSVSDFIVAAVLLISTGLVCEMILRKVKNRFTKFTICFSIIAALMIVWVELAVGIF